MGREERPGEGKRRDEKRVPLLLLPSLLPGSLLGDEVVGSGESDPCWKGLNPSKGLEGILRGERGGELTLLIDVDVAGLWVGNLCEMSGDESDPFIL